MEEEYITFRSFNSIEEAEPLLQTLKEKGIAHEAINPRNQLNSSFGGLRNAYEVQVLLKPSDFEKAEKALEELAQKAPVAIDSDHYLLTFTDDELMDILRKQDEWSEEDYLAAKELLKTRGHAIDEATLQRMKEQRMEQLREPEAAKDMWITVGYVSAVFGGFLGIIMGWLFMTSKKVLPNGEYVYAYDRSSRNSGRNIFIFGIASLILFTLVTLFKFISAS